MLIVDDDVAHQMVIRRLGERAGYATTVVSSASAALAALENRSFSIVTLDLDLGESNGVDLLQQVHRHCPQAYIVLISGAVDMTRRAVMKTAQRLQLKALDIPKPVNLTVLRDLFSVIARDDKRM